MSNDVLQTATWATVAPLLARWQMAVLPHLDGSWDVVGWYRLAGRRPPQRLAVAWPDVPQAIADVAARCQAECTQLGTVAEKETPG